MQVQRVWTAGRVAWRGCRSSRVHLQSSLAEHPQQTQLFVLFVLFPFASWFGNQHLASAYSRHIRLWNSASLSGLGLAFSRNHMRYSHAPPFSWTQLTVKKTEFTSMEQRGFFQSLGNMESPGFAAFQGWLLTEEGSRGSELSWTDRQPGAIRTDLHFSSNNILILLVTVIFTFYWLQTLGGHGQVIENQQWKKVFRVTRYVLEGHGPMLICIFPSSHCRVRLGGWLTSLSSGQVSW